MEGFVMGGFFRPRGPVPPRKPAPKKTGINPADLGADFGNQIFEQTRRRFANQFATQRNQSRGQFATRGAVGSSAAALAEKDLRAAELRSLEDASLNAQLAGTQFGQQEAGRLEGIRQFNVGSDFQNRSLAQHGDLTREGFQNRIDLQNLSAQQQEQLLRLQQMFERESQKGGLFKDIFGGLANIGLGFLPGGNLLSLFKGGGGGFQQQGAGSFQRQFGHLR
jgi:hypothetical protein